MGSVNRPGESTIQPQAIHPICRWPNHKGHPLAQTIQNRSREGQRDCLVTGSHSDRNPNTASLSQRLTAQPTLSMLAVSFYKPVVVIGSHVAIPPSPPPHLCPSKARKGTEFYTGKQVLSWSLSFNLTDPEGLRSSGHLDSLMLIPKKLAAVTCLIAIKTIYRKK